MKSLEGKNNFYKTYFFFNEFVLKDYFSVLQLINLNPVGAPLSWEYLREEWDYLVDRFTLNDRYCTKLYEAFTLIFAIKNSL